MPDKTRIIPAADSSLVPEKLRDMGDGTWAPVVAMGGAAPATIADGANVAQGSRADAAYTDTTGAAAGTLVSLAKAFFVALSRFSFFNDGTNNWLRVTLRAAGTPGSAAPSIADLIGGRDASGNLRAMATDATGRVLVEPLGAPATARQLAVTTTTANLALTANLARLSLYARGADMRYAIGNGAQTATSTSHFIANGERLDIDVPTAATAPNIAALALSGSGTLEITELV